MRSLAGSILLCLLAACASAPAGGLGSGPDTDASSRTHYLEGAPDAVWFEMRQVLQEVRVPLRLGESQPGADHATLTSDIFALSPQDVTCGARLSGEGPPVRSPLAQLQVDLKRWSPVHTEVIFRLDISTSVVEPTFDVRREACRSRGTLERRVLERTARRLRD